MTSAADSTVSTTERVPLGVKAIWAMMLAAGLSTGAIAWAVGEVTTTGDSSFVRDKGGLAPLASQVGLRNAMTAFGLLGAAMGLGFGLVGGLARRSLPRAIAAATLGGLAGTIAGAGLARLLVPIFYDHLGDDDLTYSLIVHCGVWSALGAVAGGAYGLGAGGWARLPGLILVGAIAAVLGAVIYEFAGSILMAGSMPNHPVSTTRESRLFARLVVSMAVAIGLILAGEPRHAPDRPAAPG